MGHSHALLFTGVEISNGLTQALAVVAVRTGSMRTMRVMMSDGTDTALDLSLEKGCTIHLLALLFHHTIGFFHEIQKLVCVAGAMLEAACLVPVLCVGDVANFITQSDAAAALPSWLPADALHIKEVLRCTRHLLFQVVLASCADFQVVDGVHAGCVASLTEVVAGRLLRQHGVDDTVCTAVLQLFHDLTLSAELLSGIHEGKQRLTTWSSCRRRGRRLLLRANTVQILKSCAITVDSLDLVVKSFTALANDGVVDGVDANGPFALTEILAGRALVQASKSHTVLATILELCGEGALRALHFGLASQRMQVVALRFRLFLCLHFADAMEVVVVCSLAINVHLLVVLARVFRANIVHGVNALGLFFVADRVATFVVVHHGVQDTVRGGVKVT
mmetsp:Transcript_37302/g.89210  ORF Transcript_37302/g.89210 Transcript_37302/m.89210 type:complete len:391 (-) Transcript_37302:175-1347(-)